MICGIIDYENEKYIFSFQGSTLQIENIEYLGKKLMMPSWFNSPPVFHGEYLRGINQSNGNIILFKTCSGPAGFSNTNIKIKIQYYIELQSEEEISKITIQSEELNYIYDISRCIEEYGFKEEGNVSCKTKSFEETTSDIEYFYFDEQRIAVYFTIYRGLKFGSSEPLQLYSSINLEFDSTLNYDFIADVCLIVEKWLCFMCYRKNVSISKVTLYSKNDDNKYTKAGIIAFTYREVENEDEKIIKKRNLTYDGVKGHIGNMMQDIVDDKLYLRHLPDSHKDSRKIDYSKFIMITAAIEWIAKILYPEGIKHGRKTEEAIEFVKSELEKCIDNTTGSIKKQYKSLYKLIGFDSLSQTIIRLGRDYNQLFEPVGKYLYRINDAIDEFDYPKIGNRIQAQRNNFAHGNLDQEFDSVASLDLIFLERVIYLLELHRYSVDDDTALDQIRRLFGMNF